MILFLMLLASAALNCALAIALGRSMEMYSYESKRGVVIARRLAELRIWGVI